MVGTISLYGLPQIFSFRFSSVIVLVFVFVFVFRYENSSVGGGHVTAPIDSRKDHLRRGSVELM